jgi:hypothetical protein
VIPAFLTVTPSVPVKQRERVVARFIGYRVRQ